MRLGFEHLQVGSRSTLS